MARSLLVLLTACLPWAGASADPTPLPPAPPPADAPPGRPPGSPLAGPRPGKDGDKGVFRDHGKDGDDGPLQRFRKRFQEMSPTEQEHFRQNWQRWKGMPEGEKKGLQERAVAEHARMKKVIDDAITAAGLKLTEDQREVFALRYRQERRRVEEELQKELEARRDEKMKAVIEQLKREFTPPATPAAATPTPTP